MAVPVHALRMDERPRVAEVLVEVEGVRADGRREQEQRREAEHVAARPRPQQRGERREQGEPDEPRPAREPAENACEQRPPLDGREERAGGEREEQPVRVGGREHECDRVQRDEEHGRGGPSLAEQRSREPVEDDHRHRSRGE